MKRRHSKLDRSTASRWRKLGEFGEQIAEELLPRSGFDNVRNLNVENPNFPFADFYAERNGERYAISVKIRNKYETRTGNLNSRYKLGDAQKVDDLARQAESILNAKAGWLAIQLEPKVYSAYFGLVSQLGGKKTGIQMTEKATQRYEWLANNQPHDLPYDCLKNVYERMA